MLNIALSSLHSSLVPYSGTNSAAIFNDLYSLDLGMRIPICMSSLMKPLLGLCPGVDQ